jgi:FkbM family methyltransferase
LLRARLVRPAGGFALRELLRVPDTRTYRLRESDVKVVVRHRSADPVTLGEVFHDHDYVPPPEVAAALGEVRSIIDLGANVGLFGAFAITRWPTASIRAYEPDPDNLASHERTIAVNGLQDRWSLVPGAAGAARGSAQFVAGRASLSRLTADTDTGSEGVIEVAVHDVVPLLAGVDLLKMDIEGGEWAILGDPRFRSDPPRGLVMEYHPHLCPEPDARAAAEAALTAAGMTVREIKQVEGGFGMLWAWRSARAKSSTPHRAGECSARPS